MGDGAPAGRCLKRAGSGAGAYSTRGPGVTQPRPPATLAARAAVGSGVGRAVGAVSSYVKPQLVARKLPFIPRFRDGSRLRFHLSHGHDRSSDSRVGSRIHVP